MLTTTQAIPRMLSALLVAHGIHNVVVCPGTRNAPLIIAVSRTPQLKLTTVIDERSAAFIALGIAVQTGRPVAIICTSGSAMLNFAPAIAEAYYRNIPLIAITADRPAVWIGQNDSQTIRQPGALANIVKFSADISSDTEGNDFDRYANRLLNDALLTAIDPFRPGPVHINVQLDQPLGLEDEFPEEKPRVIRRIIPEQKLSVAEINALANDIKNKKVAVVIGFHSPESKLSRALMRLETLPNVAVFHEAQSNIFGLKKAVFNPDAAIASLSSVEKANLLPDVVITVGGSVVSANLKNWLRSAPSTMQHWALGYGTDQTSIDVFGRLTYRIEASEAPFLSAMAGGLRRMNPLSDYAENWMNISRSAEKAISKFVDNAEWCDLVAVKMFIGNMPAQWNLQVSNGMSIRYIQLADYRSLHSIECNRGVSGIDGSTSTAIGASINYPHPTVLLTGDMSAQYDMGALASNCIPTRFRMAILNNDGGDIFRFIATTRNIAECESRLAVGTKLNIEALSRALGFDYILADNPKAMKAAMKRFTDDSERPVILEIKTVGANNATTIRNLYKSLKNNRYGQ